MNDVIELFKRFPTQVSSMVVALCIMFGFCIFCISSCEQQTSKYRYEYYQNRDTQFWGKGKYENNQRGQDTQGTRP